MPKYAVIIRHLPNARPVTSGIVEESKDKDIDDMDHYLISEANEIIRRFKNAFVEFKKARWYIDLLETHDNTPYRMIEIEPENV